MLNKILLSVGFVAIGATASFAQGFNGASAGFEFTEFPDVDDFGGVNYFGSAEFGITSDIAVAADLTFYEFEVGDADISNFTFHGIYGLNNTTKIGVFIGQDSIDDESIDNYGVEIAYDFGLGQAEAYIGVGDDGDDEVTYLGASGVYEIGNGIGVLAGFDRLSLDDDSATRFEIGGQYTLPVGLKVAGTFGNVSLDDGFETTDDTFIALMASINFGPQGGTTFGPRGTFETLPSGPTEELVIN